jgi:hypothetical protein
MQRALNAIEMHGNDDEPDRPVEVLVEQQVSLNDPPLHNQQANVQVAQPDQLMNISVVAYCGCPSNSTISLLLQFSKTLAIALADTGSTNTFMDLAFAKKHNIPLTPSKQQLVTVAGGGTLVSNAVSYDCKFNIQGHQLPLISASCNYKAQMSSWELIGSKSIIQLYLTSWLDS